MKTTDRKCPVLQGATDVTPNKDLRGRTFRMFRRGVAMASPVVIVAHAEAPPTDPFECASLALVPHARAVRIALAEAAGSSGTVAFVCGCAGVAARLALRLFQAGAVEMGMVS
jgi:hypothetical protein